MDPTHDQLWERGEGIGPQKTYAVVIQMTLSLIRGGMHPSPATLSRPPILQPWLRPKLIIRIHWLLATEPASLNNSRSQDLCTTHVVFPRIAL